MRESTERLILCAAVAISFYFAILGFEWNQSLWLDEALSAWVTDGSLSQTWSRAFHYQGQSPLYFMLLWAWRQAAGSSPMALRAPSLIAALMLAGVVYSLAARWSSRAGACFALILLCALDSYVRSAVSARPYALSLFGAAVSVVSFDSLLRGRRTAVAPYALGAAAAFLFQYFAVAVFGVHFVQLLLRRASPLRRLALCGIVLSALLCASALPHILQFSQYSREFLSGAAGGLARSLKTLLPLRFLVTLITSGAVVAIFYPARNREYPSVDAAVTTAAWVLCPLGLLTLVALAGSSPISERYAAIATGGWAVGGMLLCLAVCGRENLWKLTVLAAGLLIFAPRQWLREGWQEAAAVTVQARKSDEPVFLMSGLIEADNGAYLTKPEHRDYLTAVIRRSEPELPVVPLPFRLHDSSAGSYAEHELAAAIEAHGSALILYPRMSTAGDAAGLPPYVKSFIAAHGYDTQLVSSAPESQLVAVTRLSRQPARPAQQ